MHQTASHSNKDRISGLTDKSRSLVRHGRQGCGGLVASGASGTGGSAAGRGHARAPRGGRGGGNAPSLAPRRGFSRWASGRGGSGEMGKGGNDGIYNGSMWPTGLGSTFASRYLGSAVIRSRWGSMQFGNCVVPVLRKKSTILQGAGQQDMLYKKGIRILTIVVCMELQSA